jgi:hypothetical protein
LMLCLRHFDRPGVIVRSCAFLAGLTPDYNYTPLSTARRYVSGRAGLARISGGLLSLQTHGKMHPCEN